jgi:membrane-associated phospholipid phosphatase
MKKSTTNLTIWLAIFCVLITLIIVATFFDLDISKSLCVLESGQYYSTNSVLRFFEIFGDSALYLLLAASLTLLATYVDRFRYGRKFSRLQKVVCLIAKVVVFAVWAYKIFGYLYPGLELTKTAKYVEIVICAIIGIFCLRIGNYAATRIDGEILKKLAICSLIVIFTTIFSQIFVQILKHIFLRVRFRTICFLNDESLFSDWTEIKKLSGENKLLVDRKIGSDAYQSFPSGHTASAAITITLTVATELFEKFRQGKFFVLTWIFAMVWTIAVAVSRIAIGAHFLSDVVIGALITYVVFLVVKNVIYKIIFRDANKQTE